MSPADVPLLLGIDGGGTKTECWLAVGPSVPAGDQLPSSIGQGHGGPSNPAAVGLDAACRAIEASVASAFEDAGLARRPAAACVMGLAGAGNESLASAVEAWARGQAIAEKVRVVPDVELVLWAGAEDGVGIALISGTGSIAFGRDGGGQSARAGGWGYLIHDGGSAFAIGQAALEHTARASDEGIDLGELGHRILARLGIATAADLPRAIHSATDPRAAVASLAPDVFAAAANHDGDAVLILDEAADDLAALIASVHRKLRSGPQMDRVVASGSVLIHNPTFVEGIRATLARRFGMQAEFSLAPHPVAGALRLARQDSIFRQSQEDRPFRCR